MSDAVKIRTRNARAAGLILALTIVGAATCNGVRNDARTRDRVHIVTNGAIPSANALPVRFQSFDEPELNRLAGREHLWQLVAGTPRQFDQIQRVQHWVHAQWPDGTPDPYPPWNALTVLDWIRSGKTEGFCAQYAQVFLQSLAALGFTARYVEIGSRDNPFSHYVTEVWSNDFNKWVLMDADFDVHFERSGIPLSALQIHDALVSSALADVRPIFGEALPGHVTPATWPQRTAELYYYVRYHLNANHLSRPENPPFERFDDMIGLEDPRVPAWEMNPVASTFSKARLTRRRISADTVRSSRINQVHLDIRSVAAGTVTLDLTDNVLQRKSYEYRMTVTGREPGTWHSSMEPTLTLPFPDNGARVEIRGVNIRGVAGPSAVVEIDPKVVSDPRDASNGQAPGSRPLPLELDGPDDVAKRVGVGVELAPRRHAQHVEQ